MPKLSEHSTKSLELELKRRAREEALAAERRAKAEKQRPQREALVRTLQASIGCLVTGVHDGAIPDDQLKKACRLGFELAYMCLPGGSGMRGSFSEDQEPSGMDAGWMLFAGVQDEAERDEVLLAIEPRHQFSGQFAAGSRVQRLTMEEGPGF